MSTETWKDEAKKHVDVYIPPSRGIYDYDLGVLTIIADKDRSITTNLWIGSLAEKEIEYYAGVAVKDILTQGGFTGDPVKLKKLLVADWKTAWENHQKQIIE